MLQGSKLALFGQNHWTWEKRSNPQTESFHKGRLRLSPSQEFQEVLESVKDPVHIDWSTTDFNDPEAVKAIVCHLSNLVEALYQENLSLKAENQRLKDEINGLKGEKGKPDIKPKSPPKKDEPGKNPEPEKQWQKQSKLVTSQKVEVDYIL